MSVIGEFKQISSNLLERVIKDPTLVFPYLFAEDEETGEPVSLIPQEEYFPSLDIDKAWHGIHFLLTGQKEGGALPLANAILGGRELDKEVGYGPVRYLTPDEVKAVAEALSKITKEELIVRFDPETMNSLRIYPEGWQQQTVEEYLSDNYERLVQYYKDASARGNGMLLYRD